MIAMIHVDNQKKKKSVLDLELTLFKLCSFNSQIKDLTSHEVLKTKNL